VQVANAPSEEEDSALFSLDGFDMEDGGDERDGGYSGPLGVPVSGDVAFPQSDDEEISTDGQSERRDYKCLQRNDRGGRIFLTCCSQ